jgi:hypothetical protein
MPLRPFEDWPCFPHLLAHLPPQKRQVLRHRGVAHAVQFHRRQKHYSPLQPCPQHVSQKLQQEVRNPLRHHRGHRVIRGPAVRYGYFAAVLPRAQEYELFEPRVCGAAIGFAGD